jgi:hypothetical protein
VLLGRAGLGPVRRVLGGGAGDDPAVGGGEHALEARGAEIEARVDGLGDLAHRRLL